MWRRIVALVAAVFLVGRTDAAEPVTIRVAAPPGILNLIDFDFVGTVNRQLDGIARIVVLDASNSLSMVRESGADIALIPSGALANSKASGLALFDSAFQFDNLSDVFHLQQGALGDAILASVSDEGLVGLGYWNVATTHILGQPKPDLQSFKGLKVLSPSRQTSLQALGAIPISIAAGEFYAALSSGVADAADVSPNLALASRLYETRKYLTEQPLTARVYLVVASEASWNKYSLQVQSVLAEQIAIAATRLNEIVPKRESSAVAELRERGVQVVSLSSDDLKLVRANAKAGPLAERDRLAALGLRTMEQERAQPIPRDRDLDPTPRPKGQTPLFFVTDRALQTNANPNLRFGTQRGDIVYGTMRIDHGNDRPNAGPADGARITDINPFKGEGDFATALMRSVQAANTKELFIYVHGYNNTFRDSAESAALLLADLKFEGVGLIFSWPSDGVALRYSHDEQEEEVSRRTFLSVLQTLRRVRIQRIHLLAHSMGNRVVTGALELMALSNREQRPFLHHLILAAPDIYAARFAQLIPSMEALSKKTTLYVSSADQALNCSQLLHEGARAGQGGSGRIARRELDTIDVTNAETMSFLANIVSYLPPAEMVRWLLYDACRAGHSYITRNFSVVSDLHALVTFDALPEKRILLKKRITPSYWYWEMQRAAR
jgi:esterase/lipase superfamily enzyme/TRAP-type C4-dicarboxylate transport system substrate-binding protein